ncbi:SDR family oxidoreductase [Polycladomyces subterraneus]|uniref:dTDP-4-dehydrorhamnose reductase n=1 Tax=Polycladomyces subterraneus TaxID=1016997 RepID=A0ABT8ILD0_9BACL|nr:NAD(P)-dependent oxidoreductase [Polycladomyces subterraneus]MDN4593222.1 NAD(P)-dependent oxidoreductase [Polycladomyces subterraneus]
MEKKVLITGADGMLAMDFADVLSEKSGYVIVKMNRQKLDITDRNAVCSAMTQVKPDYVIHTAALSDVDYCEENRAHAFQVNGYGTENIAYYAQKVKAKFVYISTCALFGDEIRKYTESDPVVLKTVYAKAKYFGEEKTKEWCDRYFIVRPGWLFGGNINHKRNFVYQRYREALNFPEIYSAADQYGCPTYTRHLSYRIIELMETDSYGVYHISNSGSATRYEYVKKIVRTFGLNNKIHPVDSDFFKRKAPAPLCVMIKNANLSIKGFGLLSDWNTAVEEYIDRLKKELP